MRPRQPFDFEAIATVFVEQGYEGASMEDVADRAGVAKRTLYHHFGSKAELFDATIGYVCDRVVAYLFAEYDRAEALPSPDGRRVALEAFFEYAAANPVHRELLFGLKATPPAAAARIEATRRLITDRISLTFRRRGALRGRPDGRVNDVMAAMTVGATDHVLRLMSESSGWDRDAVLSLMNELWSHAFGNVRLETLIRVNETSPPDPVAVQSGRRPTQR